MGVCVKKPVYEVTVDQMWYYEYNTISIDGDVILASNSLNNLKKRNKKQKVGFRFYTVNNRKFFLWAISCFSLSI